MSRLALPARLREKAPEVLLEAAFVVFAVLLALAVDEWRQDRADAALAGQARQSLLSEIRSNLEELRSKDSDNQQYLEGITASIMATGQTAADTNPAINFKLTILSSAAWETARVTGVTRLLEFGWVSSLSRTYEVQRLFVEQQEGLINLITGFDVGPEEESRTAMVPLRNRMQTVQAMRQGLIEEYENILSEASGKASAR